MRVLFVVHNLTGGGAERVCADVASGLSRLGHSVLISTDTDTPISYNVDTNVNIVPWPKYRGAIKHRFDMWKHYKKLLLEEKPDVIVCFMYSQATLLKFLTLFKGLRIPIVNSEHNAFEMPQRNEKRFSKKAKFKKMFLNRIYDAVTVLTQADSNYIGNRLKNVFVIPNPLSFQPTETIMNKTNVVLAVGRLDVWHVKGFDILLRVWDRVTKDYPDWKLRIIGADRLNAQNTLKSFCKNLERVEFADYTQSIIEEYKRAKIFILSSRYEGFGLVLIEAMSQGCACIAADYLGRQAEIITDEVDGLITPSSNETSLESQLRRLMSNDILRHNLQIAATKSVAKFDLKEIAKRWETVLLKTIKIKQHNV